MIMLRKEGEVLYYRREELPRPELKGPIPGPLRPTNAVLHELATTLSAEELITLYNPDICLQ